jgi:predicted dehydrogenase
MEEIRVAIIGAGYMAQEHAKAFASLPGVRIAGVFSRTRARAETLAARYGAEVFDDVNQLARGTRAHAVIVTVTELSMKSICLDVIAHPWICLLEKPVGIDLFEAQEITQAFRSARRPAYVALNRRAYASTRGAASQLTSRQPRLVSVLDQQDMATARALGHPERVVHGWMYANSIHLVDYFNVFCRGELIDLQVLVPWNPAQPGHVVATLRYSSGDIGVYQAVWNGPGPWAVTVTDDQVRIELRPLERLGIQRRGERALTISEPEAADVDFKPGLHWQAKQLIEAIAGRPHALASLDESTRSMALVAGIYGHSKPGT